jgi:hypothetical protein
VEGIAQTESKLQSPKIYPVRITDCNGRNAYCFVVHCRYKFELQYFHQQQDSQIELASDQRTKRAGWMVCVDTEPFFNPAFTCINLPPSSHQMPYLRTYLHGNHLHSLSSTYISYLPFSMYYPPACIYLPASSHQVPYLPTW